MPHTAALSFRLDGITGAICLAGVLMFASNAVVAARCSQKPHPSTISKETDSRQQATPEPDSESSSSSAEEALGPIRIETGHAITVPEETPLQVISDTYISSRTTKAGTKLPFTVTRDVVVDGVLAIPCGAKVFGTVVTSKQGGRLIGASNITLQLSELNLEGKSYALYTSPFKVTGQSKTRPTMKKIATGAAVGALAMDTRIGMSNIQMREGERPITDAFAAGLGAGVGAAIAAHKPPSIVLIPAESQIEFTLTIPIAVYPVDQKTAARLAQGIHRGGPALYLRGESQ